MHWENIIVNDYGRKKCNKINKILDFYYSSNASDDAGKYELICNANGAISEVNAGKKSVKNIKKYLCNIIYKNIYL